MPFIILEGSDGSGKSTLAEDLVYSWLTDPITGKLREGRTAKNLHVGAPDPYPEDAAPGRIATLCATRLRDAITDYKPENPDHLLVVDRFHWGTPVYGKLFRPQYDYKNQGYGDMGRGLFFAVERDLHRKGAVTALLLPDVEMLVGRSEGREDEYLDTVEGAQDRADQIRRVQQHYIALARDCQLFLPSFIGHPLYADKATTPREVLSAPVHYQLGEETVGFDIDKFNNTLLSGFSMRRPETWPPVAFSHDIAHVSTYLTKLAVYVQASRIADRAIRVNDYL